MIFSKIEAWGAWNGAGDPKIDLERLLNMFYKIWYFVQNFRDSLSFFFKIENNCGSKMSQNLQLKTILNCKNRFQKAVITK